MTDIPELSGPNEEAKKDPSVVDIQKTPIKSDNDVVGGVNLGAIDKVDLDAEKFDEMVQTGVTEALKFTPTTNKNSSIKTAVAKLRQIVVTGASPYLTARETIARQLEPIILRQDASIKSHAARRSAVTSLILERSVNAGFDNLSAIGNDTLLTSRDLLRFQTDVSTRFMRQSLILGYHQLYSTKNLITLTKAFAEMVENKLEAIKINTKLPDTVKIGFLRRLRDATVSEGFRSAGRAIGRGAVSLFKDKIVPSVSEYLEKDTPSNLNIKDRFKDTILQAVDFLRKSKIGNTVVDTVTKSKDKVAPIISPFVSQFSGHIRDHLEKHNIIEKLSPEFLWSKSEAHRKKLSGFLRSFTKNHQTQDPLDSFSSSEDAVSTEGSRAPTSSAHEPKSHHVGLTRKDIQDLVTTRLDNIYTLLDQRLDKSVRANSFEDHLRHQKGSVGLSTPGQQSRENGGKSGGVAGAVSSLLGLGKSETHDGGGESGVLGAAENVAESVVGGAIANRVLRAGNAGLRVLRSGASSIGKAALGLFKKVAPGAAGVAGATAVAKDAATVATGVGATSAAASSTAAKVAEQTVATGVGATGAAASSTAAKVAEQTVATGVGATSAAASSTAAKVAEQTVAAETAATLGADVAEKTGALSASKIAGKFIAKKIPIIGAALGTYFAIGRALRGDFTGAAAEMGAGLLSTVPGWGTAGSIAIESALLARDLSRQAESKSKNETLFNARMSVYGVNRSNVRIIQDLETRVYEIHSKSKPKIETSELRGIAKNFGFDSQNKQALSYFYDWFSKRFVTAFNIYNVILERHKYTFETETNITDEDVKKILEEFKRATSTLVDQCKDLVPTLDMFLKTRPVSKEQNVTNETSRPSPDKPPTPLVSPSPDKPPTPLVIQPTPTTTSSVVTPPVQYTFPVSTQTHTDTPETMKSNTIISPGTYNSSLQRTPSYTSNPPALSSRSIMAGGSITPLPTASPVTHVADTGVIKFTPGKREVPGSPDQGQQSGDPLSQLPKGVVGSGQCVALVQRAAGIGHTSTWQQGESVVGNPNIKPGTAIAIFDNGAYDPNHRGNSHTAIYLGPSTKYPGGIRVYDQWSGQEAHERDIRPTSNSRVDSANNYSIIKTNDQPTGVIAKAYSNQTSGGTSGITSSSIPGDNTKAPRSPGSQQASGQTFVPTTSAPTTVAGQAPGSPGSQQASGQTFVPTTSAPTTVARQVGVGYKKQIDGQTWDQKSPTIMYNLMKDFGFTKEQAAGVVGNLGHECGGLTEMQEKNPVGGGRGGLGWAQWTGPRRVAYENYCKQNNLDTYSDAANYGFLKQELQTTQKGAVEAVRQTNSTAGAMMAFEKKYEAAGIKHYESRQKFADAALRVFETAPPVPVTGPGATATGNDNTPPTDDSQNKSPGSPPAGTQGPAVTTPQPPVTAPGSPPQPPVTTPDTSATAPGSPPQPPVTAPGSPPQPPVTTPSPVVKTSGLQVASIPTPSPQQDTTSPNTGPASQPQTPDVNSKTEPSPSPVTSPPPQTNSTLNVGPTPSNVVSFSTPTSLQNTQTGPVQNVINPIKAAATTTQDRPQTPNIPPPVVQSNPNDMKSVVASITQSMVRVHQSVQELHETMKTAHGPDGILAGMSNALSTATNGQTSSIFSPIINQVQAPNKKSDDDDGLDVSKKRERRYAG